MSVKARLRTIVNGTDTGEGRAFDWTIIVLIFYAIAALVYGTMPTLNEDERKFLWISEIVVTAIFTLEYILRFYLAEQKRDYSFSFYGIIDFVAILPFYLDLLLGAEVAVLRAFRALRLLRIFRLLKIVRYNRASDRLLKALSESKEEFILFFLTTLILLFISAAGIYYFEHSVQPEAFSSILHSLWWAVVTLTTVGYGDIAPTTLGGRIFTFIILLIGLGVVAAPAGLIASALSKVRETEDDPQES